MVYKPYNVYCIFKTIEAEVKNKKLLIHSEEDYLKRISQKNRDLHAEIAGMFNTRYSNIDIVRYIHCGFDKFKSFGFDKFFRDSILRIYISKDSREKRKMDESIDSVKKSLDYINRPIEGYLKEVNGNQKQVLQDYIANNIGSTVVVWCIWRHLWKPTTLEWGYLNTIENNWDDFKYNMLKHLTTLDRWRTNIRGKNEEAG